MPHYELETLRPPYQRFIACWAAYSFHPHKQTQAYIDTGIPNPDTRSPRALEAAASRIACRDDVRAVVAKLHRAMLMTPEQVLGLQQEIALSDHGAVLDDAGNVDLAKAVREGKTHLIKRITQTTTKTGSSVSVELYDRQRALESLAKAYGLDRQIVQHDVTDRMAELMEEAQAPWVDGDVVDSDLQLTAADVEADDLQESDGDLA